MPGPWVTARTTSLDMPARVTAEASTSAYGSARMPLARVASASRVSHCRACASRSPTTRAPSCSTWYPSLIRSAVCRRAGSASQDTVERLRSPRSSSRSRRPSGGQRDGGLVVQQDVVGRPGRPVRQRPQPDQVDRGDLGALREPGQEGAHHALPGVELVDPLLAAGRLDAEHVGALGREAELGDRDAQGEAPAPAGGQLVGDDRPGAEQRDVVGVDVDGFQAGGADGHDVATAGQRCRRLPQLHADRGERRPRGADDPSGDAQGVAVARDRRAQLVDDDAHRRVRVVGGNDEGCRGDRRAAGGGRHGAGRGRGEQAHGQQGQRQRDRRTESGRAGAPHAGPGPSAGSARAAWTRSRSRRSSA